MRLKYKREVKNKNIILTVEAVEFDKEQKEALAKLGEPSIDIEKIYTDNHGINVNRSLGENFKLKLRLDGTSNIELAIKATEEFLDELQEEVEKEMSKLMNKHYMIQEELDNSYKYIDIDC